jgi:hypothetical protein
VSPTPPAADPPGARLQARRRRELAGVDWFLLLVCGAVVVASALLQPGAEAVSLFGWELPGLCTFRNLTGLRCPGCGLTRSFAYMGHLQPLEAFRMHLLGPPLYLLVAAQVPWRAWRRFRERALRG